MLRFRMGWACALVLGSWALSGSHASAQERLDSSIRAWADIGIYSGDLIFPGAHITAVTPILRAELELSALQLGLDLPFAIGATSFDSNLLPGNSGFGARLGSPTLHLDYVVEAKPMRAAVGLALAISTLSNEVDGTDDAAVASSAALLAGALSRGLWNSWWYLSNYWGLIVPASIESDTDEYEVGVDAALAWLIARDSGDDNHGIFQLGGHAAAVFDPALIGLRLIGAFMLDNGIIGYDDKAQFSLEPYVELRLPVVWLGAGINLPLDEPLGILGDGADFWSLRISGGAAF